MGKPWEWIEIKKEMWRKFREKENITEEEENMIKN